VLPPLGLKRYLGAQQFDEGGKPSGMCWPGRGGDQIALNVCLIHRNIHIGAAGQFHVWAAGWISTAFPALQHACRCEQLRAMAYRGDGLLGLVELLHNVDYTLVQSQILWRPAAGYHQADIVLDFYLVEIIGQREVMPRLFRIGLVTFKVMNGGTHSVTRFLVGAYRVHL